MCDCIEKLYENLKPKVHEQFSKPNKPVQHFAIRQTMSGRAVINISIDLAKQMKPVSSFVVADFCPWCGQKYKGA